MENTIPQQNKDLVLEAVDTLFNKRDTNESSGRRTTSSTARTLSQGAKDHSTS
jgi:hypothetical protein